MWVFGALHPVDMDPRPFAYFELDRFFKVLIEGNPKRVKGVI